MLKAEKVCEKLNKYKKMFKWLEKVWGRVKVSPRTACCCQKCHIHMEIDSTNL